MDLNEGLVAEMGKGINSVRALGKTDKEAELALRKVYPKVDRRVFRAAFRQALAKAKKMARATEICEQCVKEAPARALCTLCGRRVCENCYGGIDRRGELPIIYCRSCADKAGVAIKEME